MDKEVIIPDVDVVKQATRIAGEDADDLAVMQYLMQASMASQLIKVRKYFDDRASRGWVENFEVGVTSVSPSQELKLSRPAQSLFIVNDGPGIVYLWVNYRFSTRKTLNPNDTCAVDFETHKLNFIYVQCPPGVVSNIRAIAKG